MAAFLSTQTARSEPGTRGRSTQSESRAEVTLTVDWNKTVGTVNPMSYGMNCPACFDPQWTHNAALLRPLAAVTAGARPLIRLHGWGMVAQGSNECWLNPDNTWNAEKIKNALTPLVEAGYQLMIDIPSGPGGEKDPVDPVSMAPFIASLVKIVNVDNKLGVKYWELPNEREHILSADQMAMLLSNASKSMKAVDPGIKVGGPAAETMNFTYIGDVVKQCYHDIDFVSVHTYGGDGRQTPDASYKSALAAVREVRTLREKLNNITEGKYLPIFVDEYNFGWDPNPGIYDNRGAVYFSIIQTGVVSAGGDVSAVWDFSPPHDMSIVKRTGDLTTSAQIFPLMNRYFYGDMVTAQSSKPDAVLGFAVKSSSARSIILSNLTDAPIQIRLVSVAAKEDRWNQYEITASGFSTRKGIHSKLLRNQSITLEGTSVMVVVLR